MTVGGASGPLFGTLFMSLGKELPAEPRRADLCAASGEVDRGGRSARQITVGPEDHARRALSPAGRPRGGQDRAEVADAADAAAEATKPMKAIRGRASFLGDRSIGHMDPGARSSALIVRAVAETLEPRA